MGLTSLLLLHHYPCSALTGGEQQGQSAALQRKAAPRAPKLPPRSNHKHPSQHSQSKAPARERQDSSRRKSQRLNDTAEATGYRREEPHGADFRHTSTNHPVQTWLDATEPSEPPENGMARTSSNASNANDHDLRRKAIKRHHERSQNGTTDQGESTQTQRTSSRTGSTAKATKFYRDKSYRTTLKNGVDGVRLLMQDDIQLPHSRTGPKPSMVQESEDLLRKLMRMRRTKQPGPRFDSRAVTSLLQRLHSRNERAISHELYPIVCPPAGIVRDISFNDSTLQSRYDDLVDHWDEPWSNSPSLLPRLAVPRPDYCVGFSEEAFEDDQRAKLDTIASERTTFMPTSLMYLPFLTCEVKGKNDGIEIAENQNGYSMLVTVRATVELFRTAKLEHNCSGHIMAFSISYNHEQAYIYAYYPVLDGNKTTIYRRKVYRYQLAPDETEDTTRAWNFVRNVYEEWVPRHLPRLREAIDAIDPSVLFPEPDPELMSVDSDRGANATGRAASEQPAGQRSPKRTRR